MMDLMELCTGMEESVLRWATARAQGNLVGTLEGPQGTQEGMGSNWDCPCRGLLNK